MFSFDSAQNLFWLLLLPLIFYQYHINTRSGGRILFSYGIWKKSEKKRFSFIKFIHYFSLVMLWSGFLSLILSLAGPVVIEKKQVQLKPGIDIMFVLDESFSMLAQDFKPRNRFETARKVIRDFIEKREHDQIGLLTFSREAVLRVPLTTDYAVLKQGLDSISVMELGEDTAIGTGLALACLHLEKGLSGERVIILLTDGENNAGDISPRTAGDLAVEMGIRIYTIGIGTQGNVELEIWDELSGIRKKGIYKSSFNEEPLIDLARISGGLYFHASSPVALEEIIRHIGALEKTEQRSRIHIEKRELYPFFILAGVIAVILCLFFQKFITRNIL